MESIREIYKIGHGPSSSHTMGPSKLSKIFKDLHPQADYYKIILYGSLALTGKGHFTDLAINTVLNTYKHDIIFDVKTPVEHPNTVDFFAFKANKEIGYMRAYSVGGGSVQIKGQAVNKIEQVYEINNFVETWDYCKKHNIDLYQYVIKTEGKQILEHLREVWKAMQKAIENGLKQRGLIPGAINLERRAYKIVSNKDKKLNSLAHADSFKYLYGYAYACSETNASGGVVVTAPTCGACGVIPAVLYYCKKHLRFSDEEIIKALAVAGIVGNFFKTNGSIAGAEGGCQAEVGTACSMAAAAYAYLKKYDINVIQHAAKIGITHHFGLTCDPVLGLVQIPCIERNATAATRAIDAVQIAVLNADEKDIFSLDDIIKIAYETGKSLSPKYRETSKGGLASEYIKIMRNNKKH